MCPIISPVLCIFHFSSFCSFAFILGASGKRKDHRLQHVSAPTLNNAAPFVLCTGTSHTGGHPCCLSQSCHASEDFGHEEETKSSRFSFMDLYSDSETFPALFCPFLITPCSNRRGHKSALQTYATLQDHGAGLRSSSKLMTRLQKKSHPFRTFSPQLL